MPPKRYRNLSENRNKQQIGDAMADCVFPEEIMLCILARLPVKSIVRFKSVCRPWCELFATPNFIKMHHHQFSSDPRNQDFFICNVSEYDVRSMSLFSIESDAEKPTNLDPPIHRSYFEVRSVGCCNGLACITFLFVPDTSVALWKPASRFSLPYMGIALWNPALRLSKLVWLPEVDYRVGKKISLGFGYDAEGDDFKVMRIVRWKGETVVGVEVYSAKSDSWETIELEFQFSVLHPRNDAIVNGNPYWVAKIDKNESEVLVWCELSKLKFKMVPLSTLKLIKVAEVQFVDWKGSLAALVSSKNEERVQSIDVWVFDDVGMIWGKNHTFGPIEMKVDRFLQCSKNGKILGRCLDEKLFVFDPETGTVKVIDIDEARNRFLVYGYNESLAYIKGMEPGVRHCEIIGNYSSAF